MKYSEERIAGWKLRAGPHQPYMTVNVSSWHMSVFPEFHEELEEVLVKLDYEKQNPGCYSIVREVYDLKTDELIYEDSNWKNKEVKDDTTTISADGLQGGDE